MPNSPEATLAAIQQKIRQLADSRDDEHRRRIALQNEVDALKAELNDCRSRLDLAMKDVEYLSLSHRLADNPQALAEARHTIGSLIRKVDAAIRLVKNDPADS